MAATGGYDDQRTSSVAQTRHAPYHGRADVAQLSVGRPGRAPPPCAHANATAAATDHGARAIQPTAGHARPGGKPVLRDPCPCPPLCRGIGPRALRRDKRHHVETVNVSWRPAHLGVTTFLSSNASSGSTTSGWPPRSGAGMATTSALDFSSSSCASCRIALRGANRVSRSRVSVAAGAPSGGESP